MSQSMKLVAEARNGAGKGASRELRRNGRVPAVIYGDKKEPLGVHVEEKALMKLLHTGHFMNSVVELDIAGQTHRTLPKDVQFHPVTDRPTHVDFFRVSANTKVTVAVPVRFVDEAKSPALKRGAVLNIVRHEVEVVCAPDAIPDDLVASLEGLDVGDSLHISAFRLPEGVKPAIADRDFTVATIVAPSALKSSEGDNETPAAAEG